MMIAITAFFAFHLSILIFFLMCDMFFFDFISPLFTNADCFYIFLFNLGFICSVIRQ